MIKRLSRVAFMTLWAGVLFLIATNIQSGWLYVVIAFFFLFIIISVAYPKRMLRGVDVDLSLPGLVERGGASSAKLTLKNNTGRVKYLVRAECEGGDFSFEPQGALFISIPPNGEVSAPVTVRCSKRGRRRIEKVVLKCGAPAAIYYASKSVAVDSFTTVYPRFNESAAEEVAREFNLHDPGPEEKIFASSDPYHYNLREYMPGDSLRSIHWKQTARVGEPVVRVHERKIYGQAGIVVDNIRSHYAAGQAGEEEFEIRLEEALSAAHALLFTSRYTVAISGTAADGITVENESSWENALYWFAIVELSDGGADAARAECGTAEGDADVTMFFGPGGARE